MLENIIFNKVSAGYFWDVKLQERFENPLYLESFGYKVYSQNDEDGIIHEIFERIGCTNKRFIEFGVQDGLESNTHCLLHYGWEGMWIEGNEKYYNFINKKFYSVISSGQLKVLNQYVNRNNINQLFEENGFINEIDLLSIDIDGNDYHVWKAVKCCNPRVVIIEYNAKFPPDLEWYMPYNEKYIWNGTDRHGASLKAYEILGTQLGYSLVGTNITGANAFFVRSDLTENKFVKPARAEMLYNPVRFNYIQFISGHPAEICLRYSGEGIEGEFDIWGKEFILDSGFHEPEFDEFGGVRLQWMKERKARIFVRSTTDIPRRLTITFDNQIEGLELSVCIGDGTSQKFVNIQKGEQCVCPAIEFDYLLGSIFYVDIEINQLWCPKEVFQTDDSRILGIAIKDVEVCK